MSGTGTSKQSETEKKPGFLSMTGGLWLIPVGITFLLGSLYFSNPLPSFFRTSPLVSPSSDPPPTGPAERTHNSQPPLPPESYRTASPSSDISYNPEEGKTLYNAHCSDCHGAEGTGNGPVAEALTPEPQPFSGTDFVKKHSNQFLFWRISEGKQGTSMPSFKHVLTTGERWQIVHYLHVLSNR